MSPWHKTSNKPAWTYSKHFDICFYIVSGDTFAKHSVVILMNFKSLLLFVLSIYNLSAHATAGGLENQIINFVGTNSKLGSYKGELEIREKNGKLDITRIMTYDSFRFENLKIQEVWTGDAKYDASKKVYSIHYALRRADFLKSAEGLNRSTEDFKLKTSVFQRISLEQNALPESHFLRNTELFSDTFQERTAVGAVPLWKNRRHRLESVSHESSTLYGIASQFMKLTVFNWYHNQPLPRSYSNRPEYRSKQQFMVYDPTDYDFYQSHKDILRVVNKTPDLISLTEDIQRRNAYAPSLKEKMNHFEDDMQSFHLNEFGLFSGAYFSPEGKFAKHLMDGDAALWTGMYLASQAMRYRVTHDETALSNIKKSLNGLMLLMDITGNPKEFARTIVKFEEGMALPGNLHRGTNNHQDKVWLSTGNNDMYKGLVHGFIWAYLTLPATETALRNNLLEHMKRLPDLTAAQKTQNKPLAFGLKALATNSKADRNLYTKSFSQKDTTTTILNIEGTMHVGGIADWSGVNLGMVGAVSNILIAQALGEKDILFDTKKALAFSWKDMATTKRDFLTFATYAFAIKDGFKVSEVNEFKDGYSDGELQETWNNDLKKSVWSLREIPIYRSKYNAAYDRSLSPEWCLSWWPRLPWKSIKNKQPAEFHYQSVDSYPLFEGLGLGSNFIWKDPAFAFQGETNKLVKYAGADYLYTYWMGRYSGLINQAE